MLQESSIVEVIAGEGNRNNNTPPSHPLPEACNAHLRNTEWNRTVCSGPVCGKVRVVIVRCCAEVVLVTIGEPYISVNMSQQLLGGNSHLRTLSSSGGKMLI
jgi:hypothetical protein